MKTYRVILTRTQVLNSREVEASSEKEAIDKALPTFDKIDIDDYEDIKVEEVEEWVQFI